MGMDGDGAIAMSAALAAAAELAIFRNEHLRSAMNAFARSGSWAHDAEKDVGSPARGSRDGARALERSRAGDPSRAAKERRVGG